MQLRLMKLGRGESEPRLSASQTGVPAIRGHREGSTLVQLGRCRERYRFYAKGALSKRRRAGARSGRRASTFPAPRPTIAMRDLRKRRRRFARRLLLVRSGSVRPTLARRPERAPALREKASVSKPPSTATGARCGRHPRRLPRTIALAPLPHVPQSSGDGASAAFPRQATILANASACVPIVGTCKPRFACASRGPRRRRVSTR
jgi:hypothetical protein